MLNRMRFEFLPNFKGLKFKPENYRKMMKVVVRVISYIIVILIIAFLLKRRFTVITR